jgi:hypothetical protein
VVMQQPVFAPGLGDQRGFPGTGQGQPWQTPAPVPEELTAPDEFAQQLNDMRALMERFPPWFVWFRGRRWTATRYTGERIDGGSAAEIAARLGGGKPAPPDHANPLATGPCPVPVAVEQVGQRGSPQAGQPWRPAPVMSGHVAPMPQASGAA